MTDERRYQDDEIARIFEAAATPAPAQRAARRSADGLTLTELQAIGREVGVPPDRIADAAAALDARRPLQPVRTDLGMPIAVAHTVELPRAPTDREWAMIVAELRRTFEAQGKEESHGSNRAWTNGNLHAYVEPTTRGYQLRIGTLKGDAVPINRLGVGGIMFGAALAGVLAVTGQLAEDISMPILLQSMGAAALGYNALRLRHWARQRTDQMRHIVERVRTALTGGPPPDRPEIAPKTTAPDGSFDSPPDRG